jgi:hypothetical protein
LPAAHGAGRRRAPGGGRRPAPASCGLAILALGGACIVTGGDLADGGSESPPPLEILATWPEAGAREVPTTARVAICLSAAIDPRAVDDFDILLLSGDALFDSQVELELFAWTDAAGDPPVPGAAAWCPGSVLALRPVTPLLAGVTHRVRVTSRPVGWEGQPLVDTTDGWTQATAEEPEFILEFRTASATSPAPAPAPAPTLHDLFAAGAVFDPVRDNCGCHNPASDRADATASALLDLGSAAAAFADLVSDGRATETGFPLVAPGLPSESYLIHKLVRLGETEGLPGLRGGPMPPNAELVWADRASLAAWILGGARL